MQINVNYKDSGVKTLHAFAGISFIVAMLLAVGGIALATGQTVDLGLVVTAFSAAFFMAVLGAICLGLSSVAKTALLKRSILETEHQFIEVKDKK